MSARQQDEPLSDTIAMAAQRIWEWTEKYGLTVFGAARIEENAAEMATVAYEQPVATEQQNQQQEIANFEIAVFQSCYRQNSGQPEE
jgi:hypothetical protein